MEEVGLEEVSVDGVLRVAGGVDRIATFTIGISWWALAEA